MGFEWISLRILHVGCGTFWVGSDLFLTFFLVPRLRTLGADIERAVMGALTRYLPPFMIGSSLITAVTGIWMAGSLQGWSPGWMLASGWGISMLVGLVGTAAALVIGLGLLPPTTIAYDRLIRSLEGRSPAPDEERRLARLAARTRVLVHVNTTLLIVVVIAMAIARFV